MKKSICAAFIVLILAFSAKAEPPGLKNVVEIQCVEISTGSQFIFINEVVRIEIAKSDFITSLNFWIDIFDFAKDKQLRTFLQESEGDVYFHELDEIFLTRAMLLISGKLQSGKVKLFDKNQNKYVDKYLLGEWGFQADPLFGAGGKVFFLIGEDKVEFFEVTEWMS